MGKRKEVAFEEKVSLVEEYLAGRLRMREAARRAGVGHSTMESWISRYRSEGISALEENGNRSKRKYSEDFKRQVAEEYLSGQGSSLPQCQVMNSKKTSTIQRKTSFMVSAYFVFDSFSCDTFNLGCKKAGDLFGSPA